MTFRFFAPVFLAMFGAVIWASIVDIEVPWNMFAYYTGLLAAMALCFLGIGMLISAFARTTDMAQGAAFMIWLVLLLFLDLILLGVMIQGRVDPELAVTLALVSSECSMKREDRSRAKGRVVPPCWRAGRVSLSSSRLTRPLTAATSAIATKIPRQSKRDRMR